MKNKIVVVVEQGIISSVYSSDPKAELEIIDLDSQEEDESDAANERQAEIEKDKTLSEIY